MSRTERTDTERALERIARGYQCPACDGEMSDEGGMCGYCHGTGDRLLAMLSEIGGGIERTARAQERIAEALERLADAITPRPVAAHTQTIAAALDVATDTDDPEADALLDAARDAITRRLERVTK